MSEAQSTVCPILDLAYQSVDLNNRRFGIEFLRQLYPLVETREILSRALNFFEKSVSHELDGHDIIAIPKSVIDTDKIELEEMMRLKFQSLTKLPAFLERYRAGSNRTVSISRALGEFNLGDFASRELITLSEILGISTAQQLVDSALDRFGVAVEYTTGSGIFTTKNHYIGSFSEHDGSFRLFDEV